MTTVRESLVMSFTTHLHGTRRMSLPGPVPGLSAMDARIAAEKIIGADLFDHATGRLTQLAGAVRERVQTTVLV